MEKSGGIEWKCSGGSGRSDNNCSGRHHNGSDIAKIRSSGSREVSLDVCNHARERTIQDNLVLLLVVFHGLHDGWNQIGGLLEIGLLF
jgi:hypothetical protein